MTLSMNLHYSQNSPGRIICRFKLDTLKVRQNATSTSLAELVRLRLSVKDDPTNTFIS